MRLVWSANGGEVTEFRGERRSGTAGYVEAARVSGTSFQYDDTGLIPGMTYGYRVWAVNGGGSSGYSNELTAATPDGLPSTPSGAAATAVSDQEVALTWTVADAGADIRVERKSGDGAFEEVGSVPAGQRSYQDTTATGGTAYVYRLRAHNQYGFSPYTAGMSVTTPAPASGIAVVPAKLSFPTKVRQTSKAVLTIRNGDR